jgi:hypothetical protein
MQPGFMEKLDGTEIVKLLPAVRALMYGCCADVLQTTPRCDPCVVSNVSEISLFAVTAVVFTTTLDEPARMVTKPLIVDAQAAGDVLEKH